MGAEFFEEIKEAILKIIEAIKEYLLKFIGENIEEETTVSE